MQQLSTEETIASLSSQQQVEKSAVQVRLLKGPVYRARHKELWFCLERDQFQIREYFQQIGLSLYLDDAEGYAFLKQIDFEEEESNQSIEEGHSTIQLSEKLQIPRLISRRSLSFGHTLILVLLRKRLAEHDSEESSPRLMVSRSEIYQWLQPFFATVSNEIKQSRDFDSLIKKVIEMGVLSNLSNTKDEFEVQRIIKSLVNAEQIVTLLDKLKDYKIKEEG
jgi:hypothetical protein